MLSVQHPSAEVIAYAPARSEGKPVPASFGMGWSLLLFFADGWVLALAAAVTFAVTANGGLVGMREHPSALVAPLAVCALWLLLFQRLGLYRRSLGHSALDEAYVAVAAIGIGLIPGFALASIPALWVPRPSLVVLAVCAALGIGVVRAILFSVRSSAGIDARRVVVIGTPSRIDAATYYLPDADREHAWRVPLDDFAALAAEDAGAQLGPWLERALDERCGYVIVTDVMPAGAVRELMFFLRARGATLALTAMPAAVQGFDIGVGRLGGVPLVIPRPLAVSRPGVDLARRLVDLALALPATLLFAPFAALIALAIVIDSRGPVFYRQARVGRDGTPFQILKFRTMAPDAENGTGPVWALPADARVTRLGRFLRRTSLDELPQLVNVLRGEMSLVGPRPERPAFAAQFRRTLTRYDERHAVRPGITGWSHVNMRRDVDQSAIGERLAYDLAYIEQWSPLFDASILVKTLAEFLFHRAA